MYDYIMYVMSNIWYTVYITQRNNIYLRAAAPAADPGKKCAMRSQGSKSADAWGAVVFQGQLNENKYQLFLGASHFYADPFLYMFFFEMYLIDFNEFYFINILI